MTNEAFIIEDNSNVTYINQKTGEKWHKWKKFIDCNKEEKEKINLASYPQNCILFDRDLPGKTLEEIDKDYKGFKTMLIKRYIPYFYSYRSPKGYHIIAPFKDLDKLDPILKNEIKKYYVSLFESDPAKISDRGVVSLPGKPHFKNGEIYDIFEHNKGINTIHKGVLESCKEKIKKREENFQDIKIDIEFKDYFEKDPFFSFIKNNIIPDNTNRDMTIFPNIAIAAVKSGKSKKEIDNIIKPIIKKNFSGKNYNEFLGWYNKALKGQITDYNPIQLNNWLKLIDKNPVYDLEPITIEELQEDKKENGFKFYFDDELDQIKNRKTEWLIEKWLPKGDICFMAGKAASFKTTVATHMAYAISEGKPVFNKYITIKNNVLYLNEENSTNIMLDIIRRVKKGMNLQNSKTKNISVSFLENIKIDKLDDMKFLIKYINEHKIKILFCDSFRRFISFDENNATEMNKLFNNLKILRKQCNNLTIVILHHLKKENSQYTQDLRDMLRGSSDIVNSSDSIIGFKRKHGCNAIQIEHIKNRSGEEMTNKLILLDIGEQKDQVYFYESDKEMDRDKVTNKADKCAEDIVQHLEKNKLSLFKNSDLAEIKENYSNNTVWGALKILKNEGTIYLAEGSSAKGKHVQYTFNLPVSSNKKL